MTQAQKVIKYLAIALAILLIAGIAISVLRVILLFGGFANTGSVVLDEAQAWTFHETIDSLKVDVAAVDLTIQQGDAFSVETTGRYVTCEQKGGTLTVKETRRGWFGTSRTGSLTITIPAGQSLNKADISTGAGIVKLDLLQADTLELELGAGEVTLNGLDIARRTDIDGGAGKITVQDCRLTGLDLDMGVGELTLTAALLGESDMDLGIGAADLTLTGSAEDYRIRINKGLGSVKLDGENMKENTFYGNGANRLELDGGVGDVSIRFEAPQG